MSLNEESDEEEDLIYSSAEDKDNSRSGKSKKGALRDSFLNINQSRDDFQTIKQDEKKEENVFNMQKVVPIVDESIKSEAAREKSRHNMFEADEKE